MRNINFNFWLLNCLLEIASVVVIGQTVTVSVTQVGNDVFVHQEGSLNYFPPDPYTPLDYDLGFGQLCGRPYGVAMHIYDEQTTAYDLSNPIYSFACVADTSYGECSDFPVLWSSLYPTDPATMIFTSGVQSINLNLGSMFSIFVASDYTAGEPMSGQFTLPDTFLWLLHFVEGETCFVEYTVNEEVQRIEFVVGPPPTSTTAAPSTAAPTKSPTGVPITTPTNSPTIATTTTTTTMKPTTSSPTTAAPNNNAASTTKSPTAAPITTTTNSPTTMSPTTIAPRRERLRNRIENIPIIGPALLRLLDLLNIFN